MLFHDNRTHHRGAVYILERELGVSLFCTEDQKEGVNALLGKRAPEWKNR